MTTTSRACAEANERLSKQMRTIKNVVYDRKPQVGVMVGVAIGVILLTFLLGVFRTQIAPFE